MSPVSRRPVPVLVLSILLAGCGPQPSLGPATGPAPDTARVPEAIASDVAAGRLTRVLVVLDRGQLGAAPADVELLLGAEAATDRVLRFAGAKQDLFTSAPPGLAVVEDFEQLPIALAELGSPEALAHLLADPRVGRLAPDVLNTTSLAQSLPLIAQPAAALEGKDGTGTAIAVLDTGADYRVADLGSCTAVGQPASCRVAYAHDFAVEDGLLDDAVRHGTNTASIAAAVAPGAKILALDVFDGQGAYTSTIISAINWVISNRGAYHIASLNLSLGGGSYTAPCDADPMAIALAEARQVGVLAAVATGNSGTPNAISSPACASAAVSVGAVYDANLGAIGFSACRDAATAADQVTCFSNGAAFQTLLAPGALITAGGVTMAGTSQATPHVAGALAVLRGAFPSETPAELVARLTSSGRPVTDARTGRVVPRLDLAAAAAGCVLRLSPAATTLAAADGTATLTLSTSSGCGWTASSSAGWLTLASSATGTGPAILTVHADFNGGAGRSGVITVTGSGATASATLSQGVDATPPTGTVSINGGAAWTRGTTVALALTASDPSGVAGMCVTNGTTCTTYEPFATARAWTIGSANGTQTVRVFWKDARGNVSTTATAASATIGLDSQAPTGGALAAVAGDTRATLSWTSATDLASGVSGYRVVLLAGGTALAGCATGTPVSSLATSPLVVSGLVNGTSYGFRVCAVDQAGNVAPGLTATAMPKPESAGPVGTVKVNGGASSTASASVTLGLTATDASRVTSMCLSTTTACSAWEPFAASRTFILPAVQGRSAVYASFRDEWGNVSAAPATASILLDTVAPAGGALTAAAGNGSTTLAWTAATDATTGVAGYKVVYAVGATAPASCAGGTLAGTVATSPFLHPGLANGTRYAYRVCAIDGAGNVAVGLTATALPRPESDGPVGSVTLNGGAAWTRSTTVTAALAATDASGVSQMCVGTIATSCTAWGPFAAVANVTLAGAAGTQRVYAWFKDPWGNVSASPASATIGVDATPPPQPVLTASAGSLQVALAWTSVVDSGSGVAAYRLVALSGTAVPAAGCATGTLLASGPATRFTHLALSAGASFAYRLCAVDAAGNVSAGATAVVKALP